MDYAGSADASDQRAVVEDLRSIGKVVVVVGEVVLVRIRIAFQRCSARSMGWDVRLRKSSFFVSE